MLLFMKIIMLALTFSRRAPYIEGSLAAETGDSDTNKKASIDARPKLTILYTDEFIFAAF